MSVTAETSQDPIGPCEPFEQSAGDSLRHCLTRASSTPLDFGANTVVAVVVVYYYAWMDGVNQGECAQWWVMYV